MNRLRTYAILARLNRPIGILLLLWPTLWALWIAADGRPDPWLVTIFIAGVILMRSAGCVINDYADRNIDGQVARTQGRPLPTGQVTPLEALAVFAILSLAAASLLCFLPTPARWLALPAIAITVIYPFLKRYTHLPQLVLGIAFSWGVPMAFAATQGSVPPLGWLLFGIACLWPVTYDTMYAMVDREDDVRIPIKSTAILFDRLDTRIIALLQLLMILGLGVLGWQINLGPSYFVGLLVAALIMGYLQYLIKDRVPAQCFKAFLHSQWIGCAVFLGLVI